MKLPRAAARTTPPLSLLLVLVVLCSGCLPNVGKVVDVPTVSLDPQSMQAPLPPDLNELVILDFRDLRDGLGGREASPDQILPMGEVGRRVSDFVKKALEMRGVRVQEFGPYSLQGEVREWYSTVDGKAVIPSISARASLFIELFDSDDRKVYAGTYTGSITTKSAVAGRQDIEAVLGTAMNQAIAQLINDQKFLRALSR